MSLWKTTIRIGDILSAFKAQTLSLQETGNSLAARLEKSKYASDLFSEISELKSLNDLEHYENLLIRLYDFGDFGHRISFDSF